MVSGHGCLLVHLWQAGCHWSFNMSIAESAFISAFLYPTNVFIKCIINVLGVTSFGFETRKIGATLWQLYHPRVKGMTLPVTVFPWSAVTGHTPHTRAQQYKKKKESMCMWQNYASMQMFLFHITVPLICAHSGVRIRSRNRYPLQRIDKTDTFLEMLQTQTVNRTGSLDWRPHVLSQLGNAVLNGRLVAAWSNSLNRLPKMFNFPWCYIHWAHSSVSQTNDFLLLCGFTQKCAGC